MRVTISQFLLAVRFADWYFHRQIWRFQMRLAVKIIVWH